MNRPYIIINCAMSADGKIALPDRKQMKISSKEDILRMYHKRNESDAVLVGIGTVLSDDPKLTVKKDYIKNPKHPLRVILDSSCKIPEKSLVLNNIAKTLIITKIGNEKTFNLDHVQVIGCNTDENGFIDLNCMLDILYAKGIRKLLVEGGGTIIWNFLRKKLVDDLFIYIGPYIIGGKKTPTVADGIGINNEDDAIALKIIDYTKIGPGLLIHYKLV